MTNHKNRRRPPNPPIEVDVDAFDGTGFWLYSDHDLQGHYTPSVAFGADNVFPIDDPKAYADAVARAAVTAQHDSSVARLLRERVGMPLELVGQVMLALRDGEPTRPPVEVLPGLTMTPIVSSTTLEPFIHIHVKGEPTSQNTVREMLTHASGALEVGHACEQDMRLFRVAVDELGLDDARASAIVFELSDYWPGRENVEPPA